MIFKRMTKMLIITLALTGYSFLAASEQSHAGFATIGDACCQLEGSCFDFGDQNPEAPPLACIAEDVVDNSTCNEQTGLCTPISAINTVPTLSKWGLIAMAAVLGIAGYIIVRRKRVSA